MNHEIQKPAIRISRCIFVAMALCVTGVSMQVFAQVSPCPPGHTTQGGTPLVTCYWPLPGGGMQSRICHSGNTCLPNSTLGCCPKMSGSVVVGVDCICKSTSGGCSPDTPELCELE